MYRILPYNPDNTPVRTGMIPETFRKRKGVVRGLHPSNSIAASGPKAEVLSEGWHRLLEMDGFILLVGVGLDRCSALHLAEKRVCLPDHVLRKITPPEWFVEKYPEEEWEWDIGPYPDFAKLTQPCIERGIMKTTEVGEATLSVARLRGLVDLYVEYLEKNPDLFY